MMRRVVRSAVSCPRHFSRPAGFMASPPMTALASTSTFVAPLQLAYRWCSTSAEESAQSASMGSLLQSFNIPATDPIGHTVDPKELALMSKWPLDKIRNFAIIAHIDHGKTTLSDAILRRTNVLDANGAVGAYMDKLEVEKERGITVKAQTCTFFVKHPESGEVYMMNLIDTPGHVDFQYEVTRSLKAADGAVVLVDAVQGIEAQTMANFYLAMENELPMLPAMTKLDAVINEEPIERTLSQMEDSMGIDPKEVLMTSARAKLGVEAVLTNIIDKLPAPKTELTQPLPGQKDVPFRALIFDAFEGPGGVHVMVRVMDGTITAKQLVGLYHSKHKYTIKAVGLMHPEPFQVHALSPGMVGYLLLPDAKRQDVMVGDTVVSTMKVEPVPGFKRVKPVVFAGFFPNEGDRVGDMRETVERLRVTDPSVTIEDIQCPSLGHGLQLGFLGLLHMQVFQERMFAEYERSVLVTPAQVCYRYQARDGSINDLTVFNFKWRHEGAVTYYEPVVRATIICPATMYHELSMESTNNFRAVELDSQMIDQTRMAGRFRIPMNEMARGYFNRLKSMSHGYASFEYEDPEYVEADLVKIDIVVNKASISALSTICLRDEASRVGKRICAALKSHLPRSIVECPVQAKVGEKIVSRETVAALKKDVLAKIHAGDPSRKQKKLNDQAKGKARIAKRKVGTVNLDQSVLAAAMGATSNA